MYIITFSNITSNSKFVSTPFIDILVFGYKHVLTLMKLCTLVSGLIIGQVSLRGFEMLKVNRIDILTMFWSWSIVLLIAVYPSVAVSQQQNNSLSNAVDNKRNQFFSQGDALFFEQSSVANRGGTSAQSGRIFDSQNSILFTTATGGDVVSFDWKVSSEFNFDGLIFTIINFENNVVGERIILTGDFDWQNAELVVPGDEPVFLVWAYVKDSIISEGLDAGWIDNVKINDNSAVITATILSLLLSDPFTYDLVDVFPAIPEPGIFPGKFYLTFRSTPGDQVGGGNNFIYTELNSNIELSTTIKGGVLIHVRGAGVTTEDFKKIEDWTWTMTPKTSVANQLRHGLYRDTVYFPNSTQNGLRVRTENGDRDSPGQFRIYEIEQSGDTVTKLVAEFVQRFDSGPPLHGSIYYDNGLPHAEFLPPDMPVGNPNPALPELTTAGFVARIENGFIFNSNEFLNETYTSEIANMRLNTNNLSFNQVGFNFHLQSIATSGMNATMMRGNLDIDPDKDAPLLPGTYRPSFNSLRGDVMPSFSLSPASERNQAYGQYRIFEIDYSDNGEIDRLIADYSYQDPSTIGVVTRVSLHYDSTLPPPEFTSPQAPDSPLTPPQPELTTSTASLKVIALRNGVDIEATTLDSNIRHWHSTGAKGITFGIYSNGESYQLEFARSKLDVDPDKDKPLSVGTYENANGSFFSHIAAILGLRGDAIDCDSNYSGHVRNNRFRVHDIVFDDNLDLTKIDMDFEQDCQPNGSKHIGSLRYDSTITLPDFPAPELPEGSPIPILPALNGNGGEAILITDGVVTSYSSENAAFFPFYNFSLAVMRMKPNGSSIKDEFLFSKGSLNVDPNTKLPMAPGVYENVFGYGERPKRHMVIKKGGISLCEEASAPGRFRIFEIEFNEQRELLKLVADFELFCSDAPNHITGSVNFDATQ